ncbi:MAG: histidine phosphatase family protein [Bryobacteraceae bacterium]|nr:histidine phosphatase family protein [Bryobacteraceae bacterium]
MSSIHLFRHGQAGRRDHYDTLSELGRRQTQLLGEHLAESNARFAAFFTGALKRQQETAAQIRAAHPELPAPTVDAQWNEFDLTAVYEEIAPRIAADDPEFRASWEQLMRESADATSGVHRRWTSTDIAVVRAWIEGRYPTHTESWEEFRQRVSGALQTIARFGEGESIAVSTSATPIGIWMGLAMNLENRHIMRTAGSLYNASITSFRLRGGELSLFSFNGIPHLKHPDLRTFR